MQHIITMDPFDRFIVWKFGNDDSGKQLFRYFKDQVLLRYNIPSVFLIDLRNTQSVPSSELQAEIFDFNERYFQYSLVGIAYLIGSQVYEASTYGSFWAFILRQESVFLTEEEARFYLNGLLLANNQRVGEWEEKVPIRRNHDSTTW